MSNAPDELQTLLNDALCTFRPEFVRGISEYDLINALKLPPYCIFDEHALRDPLMLFQTHFVLFHCLYWLRNQWREQKIGELDIGLTRIVLVPMLSPSSASFTDLQKPDPLADYYLDWRNLSATDEAEVDALLNSFWQKMSSGSAYAPLSQADLECACSVMKIESISQTNLIQLKQQYRKLQHLNHPDKGGNIKASQAIIQAYTKLRRHLASNA